jgi:hypothetical protein
VQSEADRARLDHKLVQLTVDGHPPPMPFDRIQCADLVGWRGGAPTAGWRTVVASVSDLVGRPPGAPAESDAAVTLARSASPRRWRLVAGGALAALFLAAGVAFVAARFLPSLASRTAPLATPVIEVRPLSVVGGDPALASFAARATDQIGAFLGDSDVRVVTGGAGAGKAQLAFSGGVSSAGGQHRLRLTLEDKRSGTALWTRDFAEPDARAEALIDRAKGAAIEVANDVRPAYGRSGLLLDSETLLHGMRGGQEAVMPTSDALNDAVHEYEAALARTPDSGIVRAAYANGLLLASGGAPPATAAQMRAHAKAEAQRVIREHPAQSGVAHLTLLQVAQAEAPRDWVGAQARLDATLKASPEEPFLYGYACSFFHAVGRASESLFYCRRALALRPHTAPFLVDYAMVLDLAGDQSGAADQALEEAARLFPDYDEARAYRVMREGFGGSPDKALALARDPATAPPLNAPDMAAFELLQKARKSRSPADGDAALAAMRQAESHLPRSDFRVLFPMALGRLDEAFVDPDIRQLEQYEEQLLMLAATEPLRRDRRFWPLAARAGLVRYWLSTNKWPDFCADPTYPLDCRAEARTVAATPLGHEP